MHTLAKEKVTRRLVSILTILGDSSRRLELFVRHAGSVRLLGLVVKASASRAENPGFECRLRRDFSGRVIPVTKKKKKKKGTSVATLAGAWLYRVSGGTGWPSVSKLCLGEMESMICSFNLGMAARTIVFADPPLRYTSMLLGSFRLDITDQVVWPLNTNT